MKLLPKALVLFACSIAGWLSTSGNEGTIPLTLIADKGKLESGVVSFGVPFPPGVLEDPKHLKILDEDGNELEIFTRELARWNIEGSVRSVYVAFILSMEEGDQKEFIVQYGAPGAAIKKEALLPNPDGPIAALLPPEWYVNSRISGPLNTVADNTCFPDFETEMDYMLYNMRFEYEGFDVSCSSTNLHRSYYDSVHGMWQRFLRGADVERYRRARVESQWYRENELRWILNDRLAIHVCQGADWNPDQKKRFNVIRKMTSQGLLTDYLLTGDPESLRAIMGMGESFIQSLAAQRGGHENSLRVTERNLGWTIKGIAAYYAVYPAPLIREKLISLIEEAYLWQKEGTSGSFEHDIVRADPSECDDGPKGASPFMTALLIDGLMDAYFLTSDERIPEIVLWAAEWFKNEAATSTGRAFKYLWACNSHDYDHDRFAELNLLIVPVFGAAFYFSGDKDWLKTGDRFAWVGMETMFVGRPKQWNQAARSFPRYLGYRANPPLTKLASPKAPECAE